MEIQGFSDYLIYPDGRVFSKKSNKYLKSTKCLGYEHVKLYDNENEKVFKIHRLVAIHYIDNPDNKPEVDHINRIRDDNRVENLRWATRSENAKNTTIRKDNTIGFKWIALDRGSFKYQRVINDKRIRKSSKDLSKLLCYSFFYILKLSNQ
jgi:hypothetical protein